MTFEMENSGNEATGTENTGNGLSQGADFREYLGKMEGETKAAREEAAATRAQLEKIAQAFGGKKEDDDKDPAEALFDQILEKAYEMEKSGQGGMPFTVSLAAEFVKAQKSMRQMQAELSALKNKSSELANPDKIQDQQAYITIDNLISESITERFGNSDPEIEKAVANKIVAEIRSLQRDDPKAWDKVRKSPQIQQKMVAHFIESAIPKNLRALEREVIDQTTPLTESEIKQAISEASQIQDPQLRREAMAVARQAYWEATFSGRGRR